MSSQVKTMSTLTCPCVLIKCLHNLKKMLNRSVNRMFDMTAVPGLCVLLLSSFPHLSNIMTARTSFSTVDMTSAHNSSPKAANNDYCYHLQQGGYYMFLPVAVNCWFNPEKRIQELFPFFNAGREDVLKHFP